MLFGEEEIIARFLVIKPGKQSVEFVIYIAVFFLRGIWNVIILPGYRSNITVVFFFYLQLLICCIVFGGQCPERLIVANFIIKQLSGLKIS